MSWRGGDAGELGRQMTFMLSWWLVGVSKSVRCESGGTFSTQWDDDSAGGDPVPLGSSGLCFLFH